MEFSINRRTPSPLPPLNATNFQAFFNPLFFFFFLFALADRALLDARLLHGLGMNGGVICEVAEVKM